MTPLSGSPANTPPPTPTIYDMFYALWMKGEHDPIEICIKLDLSLEQVNELIDRVKGGAWGDH